MKKLLFLILAPALAFGALCLHACNVTRTVTTTSQYFTKGDTTCTIITKTIESYDATKKGAN